MGRISQKGQGFERVLGGMITLVDVPTLSLLHII